MTSHFSKLNPVRLIKLVWSLREYAISIAIRGVATIAGFAVTFLISRIWGPEANGQYAIINQTAVFVGILAIVGMDWGIVKHGAATLTSKQKVGAQTFARIFAMVAILAGVAIVTLFAVDRFAYPVLKSLEIGTEFVIPLLLLIGARAAARYLGAFLRSQKAYRIGQLTEIGFFPIFVALLLVSGLASSIEELIWLAAQAGILTMIIGLVASMRYVSFAPDTLQIGTAELMKTSFPLWGVSLALAFLDWYILAVSATTLGAYDTGLLRVAMQIALVMQTIASSLFMVFSTQISASFHAGNLAKTAKITRNATLLSTLCNLPILLLILVFPTQLLGLFGEEFTVVAPVLIVLAVGQIIATLSGPCGITMAMAGLGKVTFLINVVTIGLFALAAPFVTQAYGLLGLATAFAMLMVVRNVISFQYLRRKLRINIVTGAVYAD